MGAIENLIPIASSRFLTDVGQWSSAISSTLTRSTNQVFSRTGYASLAVTASGSANASAQLSGLHVPFSGNASYAGFALRGFAWVWTPTAVTTSIQITLTTASGSTSVSESLVTRPEEWTLISVNSQDVPTTQSTNAAIKIDFTSIGLGNTAYVAIPAVVAPRAVSFNTASNETWIRLPEYIRSADEIQEDPNLPLLRFIEVLMSIANEVDTTWSNFRYTPPEDAEGVAKPSTLTDPSVASEPVVRWLIAILGSTLLNPFSGFTPWANIESGADLNSDGVVTWAELISALDTADAGTTLEWSEIENFNPSITGLSAFEKWQVSSAAYGLRGGTLASIKAAAQQAFPGQEPVVTVTPHYSGDPFRIAVTVAGSTAGDLGTIEEFVNPSMPAGFGLTVLAP